MLQISVASLEKDIKWRKSLILPTISVSRMNFFEKYFNLLILFLFQTAFQIYGKFQRIVLHQAWHTRYIL